MKQVIIKKGDISIATTPAPSIEPGSILVKTQFSCISAGTEVAGLKMSAEPLWRRALKQPENVKKILAMIAQSGIKRTHAFVTGHLNAGNPTGYSAAGVVIAVADDVTNFQVGDHVACAGAQCANHAEVLRVPKNLATKIPNDLSLEYASTVTLGAIALQGVRRANPTIGETFIVIGLGILGQLTSQMLLANGCQVVGIDLNADKIKLAEENGLHAGILPESGYDTEAVKRLTNGLGADGVIITAASASHQIVSDAFSMCRKKGRVVLVGDVGLDLKRHDIYAKELDFLVSCSYGPGRYDKQYEEHGHDYPIGYVRWTENRNMSAYLTMLANKKINLDNLISKTYEIDHASNAYDALQNSSQPSLITLLQYPENQAENERTVSNPSFKSLGAKKIRVAIVGAGGFARGMHLPNLNKLDKHFEIYAIMSRTGHSANACAKQYNAKYATTDYQQILSDPDVDLIILCTPHDQHALQTEQALLANKHILVEKPLALNANELAKIEHIINQKTNLNAVLMTGFNRRFSPHMVRLKQILAKRTNPLMINYRMNAGYIPLDHWVHSGQGGGRNIGEACHIYDLFTFLTDAKVTSVTANAITPQTNYYQPNDNFTVTCQFDDGSIANLMYTALGNSQYPKETMDVFFDGCVAHLNDYKSLTFHGRKLSGTKTTNAEKGQLQELELLASTLQHQTTWPIPWWQQQQAMQIAFAVEAAIQTKGMATCAA